MESLESIQALQQPTPGNPFGSNKKDTEASVKISDIVNTALCHQSLPRVNEIEKIHPNINDLFQPKNIKVNLFG